MWSASFAHTTRPSVSVSELVAIQRGYLEQLGSTVEQLSSIVRRPDTLVATFIESPPRHVVMHTSADRWSILMSKPGVTVHIDADRLVVDLRSIEGNVQVRLTPRDIPVLLKTLIDAAAQLTPAAE